MLLKIVKAILRTNDFSKRFIIVNVLKNPVSDKVNLARVQYEEEVFLTGGFLVPLNEVTFDTFRKLSIKEQWEFLVSCNTPMVTN